MKVDITKAESIDGFMKPEELLWLAEQASKASVVVEVGSFKGRSTRAMADHCPGVVYAVDPWGGTYFNNSGNPHSKIQTEQFETFKVNMAPHIESGRVVPVRSTLEEALQGDVFAGVLADLVFIDGDHRQEAVAKDISNGLGVLRQGGIISGHDYGKHKSWPGVKAAVDERFAFQSIGRCRSIWWVRV